MTAASPLARERNEQRVAPRDCPQERRAEARLERADIVQEVPVVRLERGDHVEERARSNERPRPEHEIKQPDDDRDAEQELSIH
jgi:hypothetical protein